MLHGHLVVELMVQMPVNLLGVSVLAQKATQYTQPLHPQQLCRQASLPGSPPLSCSMEDLPWRHSSAALGLVAVDADMI